MADSLGEEILQAVEDRLVDGMGSMGRIVARRSLQGMNIAPKDLSLERVDEYILKIVAEVTALLGARKAHEIGNAMSQAVQAKLYGSAPDDSSGESPFAKGKGAFRVKEVFLIHNDGRLVAHSGVEGEGSVDKDIMGSMLTAVQSFIADSLRSGQEEAGALDELQYGKTKILIERAKARYLATMAFGTDEAAAQAVRIVMKRSLNEIQEHYGGQLDKWDGDVTSIKGIQYFTDVIFDFGAA